MNSNILTISGVIILVALIGLGVYVTVNPRVPEQELVDGGSVPEEAAQEFITRARADVIAELGQPIEGFEPSMFLAVYAGLEEEDFDGVDALIGGYVYANGELRYETEGERELHSAARAISDDGMAELLANVSSRLDVDLEGEQGVDEVFAKIEADTTNLENGSGIVGGTEVSISGEIVCLPHKDTSGAITLECAFGLLADDGEHYGLRNLDIMTPGGIDTGKEVTVTGTLESPSTNERYDIVGVINVSHISQ